MPEESKTLSKGCCSVNRWIADGQYKLDRRRLRDSFKQTPCNPLYLNKVCNRQRLR